MRKVNISEQKTTPPTTEQQNPRHTPELAGSVAKSLIDLGGHERARLSSAYVDFKQIIDSIRINPSLANEMHAGSGASVTAFKFESNDHEYIVKIPHSDSKSSRAKMERRIDDLILGTGINGLEQIRALSTEENIVVCEFMPGKRVSDLSRTDLQSIQPEYINKTLTTLEEANAMSISVEANSENFLYSPKNGFGIIDYHKARANGSLELSFMIECFAAAMTQSKVPVSSLNEINEKFVHRKAELSYERLRILKVLLSTCVTRSEYDNRYTDAPELVLPIITKLQNYVDNAADGEKVRGQIRAARQAFEAAHDFV